VTVSVTGGPVRWFLTQRVTGSWPIDPLQGGCYVGNTFVGTRGGGRSGVWEPGTQFVVHNCGAGGFGVDAEVTWALRIGE
jgi:hypothetical protein